MSLFPLLATGISGLVGSKFASLYSNKYQVQNLDLNHSTQPTDITQYDQVLSALKASQADTVIHFAAFTNVTEAWKQQGDKNALAYQVNVVGTDNIIKACEQTGKFLIHISTAYVFDGNNSDLYTEDDKPNPIEWYGQTKWEAEQLVQSSKINWVILRIDQPFRSDAYPRLDVLRKVVQGLKENTLPPQFSNQWFGPTFIDDFAKVLDFFVRTKTTGLFHASSGEKWSPFEFANLIKNTFKLEGEVKAGDLESYLKTISRPYQKNTALNTKKLISAIDFELTPIKEAVASCSIE